MTDRSPAQGDRDRRQFVADPEVLAGLDLRLEDLADPDLRSLAIRAEHPEYEAALTSGQGEIETADGPVNPRLHLTMHEIVATQLWDNSPPEVWETAERLREAGYERHEILHMLAGTVSDQVSASLQDRVPYDVDAHVAALRALPGSWERQRSARSAEKKHDAARKQACRQARTARRRNRRPN
jgi:hypothetical protein